MEAERRWTDIEAHLRRLGCFEQMKLRPGASTGEIASLEAHIGTPLPDEVRRFLAIHDGQDGFGLVDGQQLLPVSEIRRHWDLWRSIDEPAMNRDCADMMGSNPAGHIKPMYSNRRWIPLSSDAGGNHIGLDFDPDHLGHSGQVVAFGRDEDTKRLLANNFLSWIDACIALLASATWNGEYLDQSA